jgi:hypothetical protein
MVGQAVVRGREHGSISRCPQDGRLRSFAFGSCTRVSDTLPPVVDGQGCVGVAYAGSKSSFVLMHARSFVGLTSRRAGTAGHGIL